MSLIFIHLFSILFSSPDAGFNVKLIAQREKTSVKITLISKEFKNYESLIIERTNTKDMLFRQAKVLLEPELSAIKGDTFVIKDDFPLSIMSGCYYRMKVENKDGNIKVFPGTRLLNLGEDPSKADEPIVVKKVDTKDTLVDMFIVSSENITTPDPKKTVEQTAPKKEIPKKIEDKMPIGKVAESKKETPKKETVEEKKAEVKTAVEEKKKETQNTIAKETKAVETKVEKEATAIQFTEEEEETKKTTTKQTSSTVKPSTDAPQNKDFMLELSQKNDVLQVIVSCKNLSNYSKVSIQGSTERAANYRGVKTVENPSELMSNEGTIFHEMNVAAYKKLVKKFYVRIELTAKDGTVSYSNVEEVSL